MRVVALLLLVVSLLFGETFKLYLKDGDYHVVREYQVNGDRVRYYSTERGDWEEIPLELVDLGKTEGERKAHKDAQQKDVRADQEEEQALRAQEKEIASIPKDTGGYYNQDGKISALKQADYQIVTNKTRKTLQILSPIPLVPGKASVVIKGSHSGFVINEPRPNFYMRLAKEERFGIVRLTPKKEVRIVEAISIAPVVKMAYEERKQMDAFDQQVADGLFKVWPEKPLEPGEYALIEFNGIEDKEQDEVQLMIWDFAVVGPSK